MKLFVKVNVTIACAACAAENIVMFPQSLFKVIPVVRLVACVIVLPDPAAYPIPAPLDVIAPDIVIAPAVTVPKDVSDELTTVDFNVVPDKVLASAVTVISADPLNATPFIFLGVVKVAADPVVL